MPNNPIPKNWVYLGCDIYKMNVFVAFPFLLFLFLFSSSYMYANISYVLLQVYQADQFTQKINKHSLDEINTFLNGKKALPSPAAPNSEFNFTASADICCNDNKRTTSVRNSNKTTLVPIHR